MKSRQRRNLEVISISALDLFASALGVFILMSVVLFPYYLRQPSTEKDLAGARAEQSAAGISLSEAQQIASEAQDAMAEAEARRSKAQDELQKAEASLAEAEQVRAIAARRVKKEPEKKAADDVEKGRINVGDLDIVFVLDTTSSMKQEIEDVQTSLLGIIRVLHRLAPSLNVGFVAYRDRSDAYLTRTFQLAPMTGNNLKRIQVFVERLRAAGGGDVPEAVDQALSVAKNMPWRTTALGWIIVVGDAPAHRGAQNRTYAMARNFHSYSPAGIVQRRISAIFTGSSRRRSIRQFFQRLAEAGGGDYVEHRGRIIESVLLSILTQDSSSS
ncbi:MAG: VWA domain-containing protein [Kiloniellales bacterium]|nr:VWA domain-containing protein [Kiloniellales bacterium]MDJ0972019.1 VWA domain-containing protein [Kiloniellales bacterium]